MNLVQRKIFLVALLTACAVVILRAQSAERLSVQGFERKLNEVKEHTLLDVRTQNEYDQGHLPGAVLLDFYRQDFKKQLSNLDKNKPVFIYCAAGSRSQATTDMLADLGFKRIYELQGGMRAWSSAKMPIIKQE